MRIIAGERKGHTIYAPKGLDTRPTSDRVRENVFNIVAPWVEDARVLDLFAGSGAMGLEALSRASAALTQEVAAGRKYDLVLVDPPYEMTDYDALARYLPRVLAEDGLLVLESSVRSEPALPGLEVRTTRKYGSTRVTVFEHE